MTFKQWFENNGATTSLMHGGIQDLPGERLNTNYPVQSKYATKDGSSKVGFDVADGKTAPDKKFGFTSREDKIKSIERKSKYIDKDRKSIPMEIIPPDIIY